MGRWICTHCGAEADVSLGAIQEGLKLCAACLKKYSDEWQKVAYQQRDAIRGRVEQEARC